MVFTLLRFGKASAALHMRLRVKGLGRMISTCFKLLFELLSFLLLQACLHHCGCFLYLCHAGTGISLCLQSGISCIRKTCTPVPDQAKPC